MGRCYRSEGLHPGDRLIISSPCLDMREEALSKGIDVPLTEDVSKPIVEASQAAAERLAREVARRRTFAIISHPDAGKTTLTEKFLVYSGAVALAGAVRARKNQRHATSDWMTLEQERGISVTATALEIDYLGYRINLLDTPGHQDFSEDTYRTLTAADSAVMVLDSAKGIEPQTEKLFRVCRASGIPILTFINKMDRSGRDPLDLLDEIERMLGIAPAPMNWPIGSGPDFQGVYDLEGKRVLRFERTAHNQTRSPMMVAGLDDPALRGSIGERAHAELKEHAELLAAVGHVYNRERFLDGEITPVFFGSALNNFGVEPFLQALIRLAPAPEARQSSIGPVEPTDAAFSGFIFKVQANMDPRHRDRMAFLRICSGRFEKDVAVKHTRLGKSIKLTRAFKLFARERDPIEEAYPGDVVGLISPGLFAIGDSITTGEPLRFPELPRFAPEWFSIVRNTETTRYKQFKTGLQQLEEEGAIQVFQPADSMRLDPILAAVGKLQFDVVLSRLKDEYDVDGALEPMDYALARWVDGPPEALKQLVLSSRSAMECQDQNGLRVALFKTKWDLEYCQKENPGVSFLEVAPAQVGPGQH